jgi:hypothetical protein
MNQNNEDYLNTTEAGAFTRRSPGAIRNLVMRREIPHRKVAGRLVFLRSELEAWIENSPGVSLEDLKMKRR